MPILETSPRVEDVAALAIRTALKRGRKPTTLENKRNAWESKIVPSFGGRCAATLEHEEAQDAAIRWADQFGPHAAKKAAREAGHGWKLAMRRGWMLRSPWDGVYIPGAVRGVQRVMPAEARQSFRSFLEPIALRGEESRFRRAGCLALLMLAECPAGRLSETASLEWSGVDLSSGVITWLRHKTDHTGPKHAVITPYMRLILAAARTLSPTSKWVFPAPSGKPVHDLTKTMSRVCARIGLPTYTPHDLRRGIAQEAIDAGCQIEDVSALLGHESVATTESYLRWSSTRARRAQNVVSLGSRRGCPPPPFEGEALGGHDR